MEEEVVSALTELIRDGKTEKLQEVSNRYFEQIDQSIQKLENQKKVIKSLLKAYQSTETPQRRGRRKKEEVTI